MTTCYLPPILVHSIPGGVAPAVFMPLWERARDGDRDAAGEIVRRVLPLAFQLANQFARRRRVDIDDALSDSLVGIHLAIRGYRPDLGFAFTTYAAKAMQQQMNRGRKNRHLVHMSSYTVVAASKLIREAELAGVAADSPIESTFANPTRRAWIRSAVRQIRARIEPESAAREVLAPAVEPPVEHDAETRRALGLLAEMHPQWADVIRMRYGLDGRPGRTLKQIGILYGLTRERIRQIEQKAMRQLRAMMIDPDPRTERMDPC